MIKNRLTFIVYAGTILLFLLLCFLSIFEFVRCNSLSSQVTALKGSPVESQANEIKKLQSDLEKEQQTNKQLTSQYNDLNNKYQDLQSQITKIQNTKIDGKHAKVAYLTFDDGPSKLSGQLLDALKASNVHATFFVIGINAQEYPDILKRTVNEGHVVGIHSWTHNYSYIYKNMNNFMTDFNQLKDYLTNLLGTKPDVCRFPGGTNNTVSMHYSDHIMRSIVPAVESMGIREFDWNSDAGDATTPIPSKDKIVNNVINETRGHNQAVILCHDFGNRTSTIDAIPQIVASLRGMGYTFETLSAYTPSVQFKPV